MKRKNRTRHQDDAEPVIRFAEDLRSVFDLENATNTYGRKIFVEEWKDGTGKPKIWYEFNKQGYLLKYERNALGILISNLGKTQYI
jgi:hypothetical protein